MLLYKGTVHPKNKILSVITHPRKENIINKFIQQFIFFVRREEPLVNGGRLTRKRRSHWMKVLVFFRTKNILVAA